MKIVPSLFTPVIITVVGHVVIKMLEKLFGEQPIIDEEKFAKEIAAESQKLREEHERIIHQNKLILSDLENWMEKTTFTYMDYREGEFKDTIHRNPNLPHFEKTKKVLENRNAYILWTNGVETSNNLKKKGKKAIELYHTAIEKELEVIPLKKSLGWRPLPEDSYYILSIRQSIFDGIKNIKNLNLHIKNRFLNDGGRLLAEGEQEILVHLKKIIENLVENDVMRENIRIFNEAKEKLDWREPFKEFQEKLDEIIQEYRFSKIRS